jgi:rod shape-determining protein MreD
MLLNPNRYWWLLPISLVCAFLWQFWPLPLSVRGFAPDAIVVATLYWATRRPPRVSGGWALIIGLARDSIAGSPLGTHALALVLITFLAQLLDEQLRSLAIWQQTIAVGVLCAIYQLIGNGVWMLFYQTDTTLLLPAAIATGLCWPVCYLVLNLLEHGYSRRPNRS